MDISVLSLSCTKKGAKHVHAMECSTMACTTKKSLR